LRSLAKARTGSDPFVPRPFVINLFGLRRHLAATDEFDDRLVVFMALPGEESRKALSDLGIEDELIDDINQVAAVVKDPGVRRVSCDRIESAEGVPITGHWLTAVLPITTDPGMVRLYRNKAAELSKLDAQIAAVDARIANLKELGKRLDAFKAAMKSKGDALKGKKLPRPGEPVPEDRRAAEEAVKLAQEKIDTALAGLDLKATPTAATLAALIKQRESDKVGFERARDQAQTDVDTQAAWKPGTALTQTEKGKFGASSGFRNENGDIEANDHAYFPLGVRKQSFKLFLHHWNGETAMPALTIGMFWGDRVVSGWLVKNPRQKGDIWDDVESWRIGNVNASVQRELRANNAEEARRRRELAGASNGNKRPDAAMLAAEREAKTRLEVEFANKRLEIERPLYDAKGYCLELAGQRRAVNQVPAGALVMPMCSATTPDGRKVAIADADRFRINELIGREVTGRELRLHLRAIAPQGKPVTVAEHLGADPEHVLPAGTTIEASGVVYDLDGKTWEIADDDILIVKAPVGGTNIHRGHHFDREKAAAGTATSNDAGSRVGNWSTGCQVVQRYMDYSLFILLSGLSKRVSCMGTHDAASCARLQTGSADAPDPFVWHHARVKLDEFLDLGGVITRLADLVAKIVKEHEAATRALNEDTRAWFKTHKDFKPPKGAEDALDSRRALLDAALEKACTAELALKPKPEAAPAKALDGLAAATAEREAAEANLHSFVDARLGRDALHLHADVLKQVIGTLSVSGSPTFEQAVGRCELLAKKLQEHESDAHLPADAPGRVEIAKAREILAAAPIGLRRECFTRAVIMQHDWMRRCDLAHTHAIVLPGDSPFSCDGTAPSCHTCGKLFDYTLVELDPANTTPEFDSMGEIDAEFIRKTSEGHDAHPRWRGFGA